MELKPYPEYKDSGVPWLEEIPAHWEVEQLVRLLTNPLHQSLAPIDQDSQKAGR